MMITGNDAVERTRPLVEVLFDRERRRRGSKMSAYAAVGDIAGVSESWVRRLLGRRHVVVELHHYLNLAEAYRRACERVEAERALEERTASLLRKEADAIIEGPAGLVVGASRADQRGATP